MEKATVTEGDWLWRFICNQPSMQFQPTVKLWERIYDELVGDLYSAVYRFSV